METVIPMRIDMVQGRLGLRKIQGSVMMWRLEDTMYVCAGACYEDVTIIIDGWADTCQ
jgi:hypothetical protein